MATAIPCPCGHKSCKAWMVEPQAAVQGVNFTKKQAELVAAVLNGDLWAAANGNKVSHPDIAALFREQDN